MNREHIDLTSAEWNVMECLWEKSPRTGREAAEWLKERVGWSRSTVLTLLRRLEEKGAVSGDERDGKKSFRALLRREDAALREAEDLLDRAYRGSLSLMVSALTKKQTLSQGEIDELYDVLRKMEEGNKS